MQCLVIKGLIDMFVSFPQLVPQALAVAMEEDVDMRRGLPTDYLQYMGVANSDSDNPQRKSFLRHIEQLMTKLLAYAPVDAAADQMGKKFIYDTLPPVLTRGKTISRFLYLKSPLKKVRFIKMRTCDKTHKN